MANINITIVHTINYMSAEGRAALRRARARQARKTARKKGASKKEILRKSIEAIQKPISKKSLRSGGGGGVSKQPLQASSVKTTSSPPPQPTTPSPKPLETKTTVPIQQEIVQEALRQPTKLPKDYEVEGKIEQKKGVTVITERTITPVPEKSKWQQAEEKANPYVRRVTSLFLEEEPEKYLSPKARKTPVYMATQEKIAGFREGIEKQPLKTGAVYGVTTAATAGLTATGVAATPVLATVGAVATGVYAGKTAYDIMKTPKGQRMRKLGRITSTEILPFGLGAKTGTALGKAIATKVYTPKIEKVAFERTYRLKDETFIRDYSRVKGVVKAGRQRFGVEAMGRDVIRPETKLGKAALRGRQELTIRRLKAGKPVGRPSRVYVERAGLIGKTPEYTKAELVSQVRRGASIKPKEAFGEVVKIKKIDPKTLTFVGRFYTYPQTKFKSAYYGFSKKLLTTKYAGFKTEYYETAVRGFTPKKEPVLLQLRTKPVKALGKKAQILMPEREIVPKSLPSVSSGSLQAMALKEVTRLAPMPVIKPASFRAVPLSFKRPITPTAFRTRAVAKPKVATREVVGTDAITKPIVTPVTKPSADVFSVSVSGSRSTAATVQVHKTVTAVSPSAPFSPSVPLFSVQPMFLPFDFFDGRSKRKKKKKKKKIKKKSKGVYRPSLLGLEFKKTLPKAPKFADPVGVRYRVK